MAGGKVILVRQKRKKSAKKSNGTKRAKASVTKDVNNAKLNRALGMPLNLKAKLRYVRTFDVNAAAPTSHQFFLNRLDQPDPVVGFHQPMQYDQYAAWYNRYLVTGTELTCLLTTTNAQDTPMVCTYAVRDNATIIPLTIAEALEQGNRSVMQIGYAGGGSASKTMTRKAMVAKYHGVKSVSTRDTDYTGATNPGAAPFRELYGTLQVFRADDTILNISYSVTFILDFDCQFYNQREVAQS